jgi:cysteine desulfurase/selenocysteine lyase
VNNSRGTIDIAKLREETPLCRNIIHFNNAGASPMPQPVYERLVTYLQWEQEIGGYEAQAEHRQEIEGAYRRLADLIGAQPSELALVGSASRAFQFGLSALPLEAGHKILTSRLEYGTIFMNLLQRREAGVEIEVVPEDGQGVVDLERLEQAIDGRTRLIVLTHIPTHTGTVQPAQAIGRIARKHGLAYFLNATQSLGVYPLHVEEIGCDLMCSTSRKWLRGPRGLGMLYVRSGIMEQLNPPFPDVRAAVWEEPYSFRWPPDARAFETWESNPAATLALGEAAAYAQNVGLEAIWQRVQNLASYLRQRLGELPGAKVHDRGQTLSGIVAFTLEGVPPPKVKEYLRERKINVYTVGAKNALLDMQDWDVDEVVRASVHYFNTEGEVDTVVRTLAEASFSRI